MHSHYAKIRFVPIGRKEEYVKIQTLQMDSFHEEDPGQKSQ